MTHGQVPQALTAKNDLRSRLRRHGLVFVQCGAAFGELKHDLLEALDGVVRMAEHFAVDPEEHSDLLLVLTGVETFAREMHGHPASLGELRLKVSAALDRGCEVCLISSAPRVSYPPIPGSSLLDDASAFFIDLEAVSEEDDPAHFFPSIRCGNATIDELFREILLELGFGVLASLDRAVFDSQLDRDAFMNVLDPREIEALRGAGLAVLGASRQPLFSVRQRFGEFKEALSSVLADHTDPQEELAFISAELWRIERSIRKAVRAKAMREFGQGWRGQVLHGDLSTKVLERALMDGSVGTRSVRELRDPIEWLTLGELLEVINTATFGRLGLAPAFWPRFAQEILPIRNRLSHMRHFKTGDRSTVTIWSAQVDRMLPR